MNEIKKLTESIKKANKRKKALDKEKKRAEREIRKLDLATAKRTKTYKFSKRREVTFKFI